MEIPGELKANLYAYALTHANRSKLFHQAMEDLCGSIDQCEHKEAGLHPKDEFLDFVASSISPNKFLLYSLKELKECYECLSKGEEIPNRKELITMGSSIAIVFVEKEDNELVSAFMPFLFSISENSGEPPEGMPDSTVQLYLQVLSRYVCTLIQRFMNEVSESA